MTSSSPQQPRLLDDPNLRRLFGMVLGHRKVLAFALLATAVAAATDPILAKLTGVLTDRALLERDSRSVMWLPLAFVGLFIVRGLASFASSYLLNRISQSVLMNLRMTMFDRMLRWRAETFEQMSSSVVISKFVNEATNAFACPRSAGADIVNRRDNSAHARDLSNPLQVDGILLAEPAEGHFHVLRRLVRR